MERIGKGRVALPPATLGQPPRHERSGVHPEVEHVERDPERSEHGGEQRCQRSVFPCGPAAAPGATHDEGQRHRRGCSGERTEDSGQPPPAVEEGDEPEPDAGDGDSFGVGEAECERARKDGKQECGPFGLGVTCDPPGEESHGHHCARSGHRTDDEASGGRRDPDASQGSHRHWKQRKEGDRVFRHTPVDHRQDCGVAVADDLEEPGPVPGRQIGDQSVVGDQIGHGHADQRQEPARRIDQQCRSREPATCVGPWHQIRGRPRCVFDGERRSQERHRVGRGLRKHVQTRRTPGGGIPWLQTRPEPRATRDRRPSRCRR